MAVGTLREQIEAEAGAAAAALGALSDERVTDALEAAAALLAQRSVQMLEANGEDVAVAADTLDEGALDRLRLDDARLETIAAQLESLAGLPPLEREISSWTLDNGLRVRERRIPVGVVGANFEARPNVAVDVAGQLLKSRNAALLRTGGAALRTVTALVDHLLRPPLEQAGLPPGAVGLVRWPHRDGAPQLLSPPHLAPPVLLRGSAPATRALPPPPPGDGDHTP